MKRILTVLTSAGAAMSIAGAAQGAALPPGVSELGPDDPCPARSLCVYRDVNFEGPAYAIRQGHKVNLYELPCTDTCGSHKNMANNVSSWHNRGSRTVKVLKNDGKPGYVYPGQRTEGGALSDSAVEVSWIWE